MAIVALRYADAVEAITYRIAGDRWRDVPKRCEVRQWLHRAEDARDGFSGQKAEDEFKADLLRVLSDCIA